MSVKKNSERSRAHPRRSRRPSHSGDQVVRQPLQVLLELGSADAMHDVLTRVVQAAGGRAGLMATWDAEHPERGPHTATYNLDDATTRTLADLLRQTPALSGRAVDGDALGRVENDVREASVRAGLGPLEVLALPVRFHDARVGLLCLLHPSHAAGLLKKSPGVYNICLDQVEVVVQNARLLQRLLAERKWLEAMVAQNANGIAIVDAQGTVVGFNESLERLSGWSLDEAVGHEASKMFPVKVEDVPRDARLVPMDRGSTPRLPVGDQPVDARLCTRAGEWIDVEASTTTLWDENQLLGWALTLRDIRQRKEKERLEHIFLSSVSHELQTPIAVIKGFSGILSDAELPLTVEQAREKAAIIHQESERLERMVGQLLFATRIQAGGVQLQREPVALGDLVIRTAHKLEPLARELACTLNVEVADGLPDLRADTEKIEQVLTNLIENALKFSSGSSWQGGLEPEVSVRVTARGDQLEVSVTDHGPGVSASDRERIFHPFERGKGATRAAGSGLGLFICKSIVEAHRGHIGVENVEGGGARFYFTLPRTQ